MSHPTGSQQLERPEEQQNVFMSVNVASTEEANASVKVSVSMIPEPSIHVDILAGSENDDAGQTTIHHNDTKDAVKSYFVTPGSNLTDEFVLEPHVAEPERASQGDQPGDAEAEDLKGRNFKMHRTQTLEIPETNDPDQEYEYLQIRKGDPQERDPLWFPVVTAYPKKNSFANLWVKMDTGADINLIAMATIEALGLENQIKPYSPIEGKSIDEMGGNKFTVLGSITLEFKAGHQQRPFKAEFLIPSHLSDVDEDKDGLPNVIVGWSFILQNHLLMVDYEYHNEAVEEYETLAVHSMDETKVSVLKACPLVRQSAPGYGGGRNQVSVRPRPSAGGYVRRAGTT